MAVSSRAPTPPIDLSRGFVRRAAPWVALFVPPFAWFSFELGLATVVRWSCVVAGSWVGVAWGAAALVVCGLAALLGWTIARRATDDAATRPWLARLASLGAGLFSLAIVFQMLATRIVPSCAR